MKKELAGRPEKRIVTTSDGMNPTPEQKQNMEYIALLEDLLVMEFNKTRERAKELIQNNPDVILRGIAVGNQTLRAAALLLDDFDAHGQPPIEPFPMNVFPKGRWS